VKYSSENINFIKVYIQKLYKNLLSIYFNDTFAT